MFFFLFARFFGYGYFYVILFRTCGPLPFMQQGIWILHTVSSSSVYQLRSAWTSLSRFPAAVDQFTTDIITVRPKCLRCAEVLLQLGFIGTGVSGFRDTSFRIYPEADGLAEFRYCHVDFCVPAFPAMKGP